MDFINAFAVSLQAIGQGSGFSGFTSGNLIMILVGLVLLYLAFARDFEPLLLSPIAFGCILANIPFNGFEEPGVMSAIGMGIKYEIFPPLIFLGFVAFIFGTAAGVVLGKIMCRATGWKVNPLIGSAGVSAVPMAARVSQIVGIKAKPGNYLLMHAMGPNVAGVIGTAVAAGAMLAMLGR